MAFDIGVRGLATLADALGCLALRGTVARLAPVMALDLGVRGLDAPALVLGHCVLLSF